MSTYKIADVTKDLTFLVSLTTLFAVDDKGFWIDLLTEERFKYSLEKDDAGKEIVLFQDPMPKGDYYYFNPLAEGLGDRSPANKFFERTVRVALNTKLRTAIIRLVTILLASKTDGTELDHVELRMSGAVVDRKTSLLDYTDEKFLEEVTKIFDRVGENFLTVSYIQTQQTARVRCELFSDPQWTEKYGQDIRKKSIPAFRAAVMAVLGITDEKEMVDFDSKYNPENRSAVKLDTTMRSYYKLFSRFNHILPDAHMVDLGEFNEVIERLPMAYKIAKHMVQPSMPRNAPTDLSPADTSRIATGMATTVAPGGRRMPSPILNQGPMGMSGPSMGAQPMVGPSGRRMPSPFLNPEPIDPTSPTAFANVGSLAPMSQGGFSGGGMRLSGPGSTFTPNMSGPNLNPGPMFGRPELTRRYFPN